MGGLCPWRNDQSVQMTDGSAQSGLQGNRFLKQKDQLFM